jgi:hypothetical protein
VSGDIKIKRHRLKIKDDFVTPEGLAEIKKILDTITELAAKYRESKSMPQDYTVIPRGRSVDKGNWGLQYLINTMSAFEEWLDTAPSSATVESFYDPDIPTLPSGTPIDPGSRSLLVCTKDGIGLRSRAKVLSDLMTENLTLDENWLSLACGGAVPCLKAVEAAKCKPSLTLVDFDTNNLRVAGKRAAKMGLKHGTKLAWRDLTSKKEFGKVPVIKEFLAWFVLKKRPLAKNHTLKFNHYDRVEATGFIEYLPTEMAVRFIRNTFKHVKPGGTFITSNIRDTHSERAFTEGVVQWPLINFRTVEEVVELVRMADIDVHQVDVYLPDDDVYAIYVMRKN